MREQIAPFRSHQGQAEYLAAYDAALMRWPIPYESRFFPTRFGNAHVIVGGLEGAPAMVFLHGMIFAAVSWAPTIATELHDHIGMRLLLECGLS